VICGNSRFQIKTVQSVGLGLSVIPEIPIIPGIPGKRYPQCSCGFFGIVGIHGIPGIFEHRLAPPRRVIIWNMEYGF